MAGIYVHVPFCKQICTYCDFYKIKNFKDIDNYTDAVIKELFLRKDYISDKKINTIYFGGGTPSVLKPESLQRIIDNIKSEFTVSFDVEITMEMNPDDITEAYLKDLRKTEINRVSMGIQSFIDKELELMNRRHSADQAIEALKRMYTSGINNISVDLIYGSPESTMRELAYNLSVMESLKKYVTHISAYIMTVEKGTMLYKDVRIRKSIKELKEDVIEEMYLFVKESLEGMGFIQYEISNFSKKGYTSIHNSNYWKDEQYLGLGPSAHSFNQRTRTWNVKSAGRYVHELMKNNTCLFKEEALNEYDVYNEMMIKRLRTKEGIRKNELNRFNLKIRDYFWAVLDRQIRNKTVKDSGNSVSLTNQGELISDYVIGEFIIA